MAPGYLVTLEGCPRSADNTGYLIVELTYRLQEGGYASGSSEAHYDFDFVVQPTSLAWRAPAITPVPRATGPQTAVVVGPASEQIWTDEYGRVKLQFRWDRYGHSDENSSCWVRVSSAWAGSEFGALHVPRIGQEVIVDFLNGELDRPIVTGRVYNADQMPPFGLPGAATQSGIVTRTPGGTTSNANLLRFEDKPGAEQVLLHAERNYDVSVEQNATQTVGQNSTQTVGANQTIVVDGDSTDVTIGNSLMVVIGTMEMITPYQMFLVGVQQMNAGLQTAAIGTQLAVTGVQVGATGVQIGTTGVRIGDTSLSVESTGLSVAHVGYSVKF
jgi:type VI secretion system secreted protein VgrG